MPSGAPFPAGHGLAPEERALPGARAEAPVAAHFRQHERFLHGLCYRLTGSAADADDLVQETFLRAMERPPARVDEPLRPWLVRVAVNLGRDALRRRKRQGYKGPWLPSPIETDEEPPSIEIAGEGGTEGRYDLMESVSFAFLLALEALKPRERAVLLLRDVFDYSVKEAAEALGMSEANVKTTHHRARRALEPYEGARVRPSPSRTEKATRALMRFLQGLADEDVGAVEALLARDVRLVSDGGGEFMAAGIPVVGAAKVAKLSVTLHKKWGGPMSWSARTLNGLPTFVGERAATRAREAPRFTVQCDVDEEGRIRAIYSVLATRKLTAVRRVE